LKFDVEPLLDTVLSIDVKKFYANWDALKCKIASGQVKVNEAAGFSCNVGSAINLTAWLITDLGLEPQYTKKKSTRKKHPSFAKEVLTAYDTPETLMVIEQKSLLATDKCFRYTEPHIERDGHEAWLTYEIQPESTTGRVYGKAPPIHSTIAEIRECIIPDTDRHTFVNGDYRAQELCIAASICGCQSLIDDIQNEIDVMARLVAGSWSREQVKTAIYAFLYGSTPGNMAYTLNKTKVEIDAFLTRFFTAYPGMEKWMEVRKTVEERGYAETIFGDRYTLDLTNVDSEEEIRRAVNFICQGSAAGVLFRAMQVLAKIPGYKVKVPTFDALLVQVPNSDVSSHIQTIKDAFDGVLPGVLSAKVTSGSNWCEAWKPTAVAA